jgi:type II secretory pathway pseudopilin PulG
VRLRAQEPEAGLTLVELLVAAAMSVILVGAAGSMLISAVRSQPNLSEKTQNISTARWVLERMTREIRNGIQIFPGAAGSRVEFETQVRRAECGGAPEENPAVPAIECRVTYECAPVPPDELVTCTRTETAPETPGSSGTPVALVSGLISADVFSPEGDYIEISLQIANPEGKGALVIKDGAGLRIQSYQLDEGAS